MLNNKKKSVAHFRLITPSATHTCIENILRGYKNNIQKLLLVWITSSSSSLIAIGHLLAALTASDEVKPQAQNTGIRSPMQEGSAINSVL